MSPRFGYERERYRVDTGTRTKNLKKRWGRHRPGGHNIAGPLYRVGFGLPCLKHGFENTFLILLAVCTMLQIARDKECHHPCASHIQWSSPCVVARKKYSNHCLMQSTFHEMEYRPRISLNKSRCKQSFPNVIHKRSYNLNPPYSRQMTISYHPSTRKLICNWRLLILHVRYIRARVWARGDGETLTINYMGTSRVTDRNAVVEWDEERVWVSAKVISKHACAHARAIKKQWSHSFPRMAVLWWGTPTNQIVRQWWLVRSCDREADSYGHVYQFSFYI